MSQKKPTPADAGRLVRKAAEIIDDSGWAIGSLQSGTSFCISGALNKAYCGNPLLNRDRIKNIPLLDLSHKMLDQFFGMNIELWNDVVADTKENVIRYLNKFADEHDPQRV